MTRLLAAALGLAVLAAPGCGYALAGRGTFLPAYIQTIGIPTFINDTPYEVEQIFTERMRSEFIGRGKYKVLPQATDVDALLIGEIVSLAVVPASFTGEQQVSRYLVVVTAKMEFRDVKADKVIWDNPAVSFREELDAATGDSAVDPTSFFRDEVNSVDRISTAFARSVVSSILEAF